MTETNFEFISYVEDGQRYFFHAAGTRIFRDGTYYCPECRRHRPLSPKHRKLLARYIETAEHEAYRPEACR